MKPIIYTDIFNRNEKHAKIIGCKFKIKALNCDEDRWYTLFYKEMDSAQKEHSRMGQLLCWKHISEITSI